MKGHFFYLHLLTCFLASPLFTTAQNRQKTSIENVHFNTAIVYKETRKPNNTTHLRYYLVNTLDTTALYPVFVYESKKKLVLESTAHKSSIPVTIPNSIWNLKQALQFTIDQTNNHSSIKNSGVQKKINDKLLLKTKAKTRKKNTTLFTEVFWDNKKIQKTQETFDTTKTEFFKNQFARKVFNQAPAWDHTHNKGLMTKARYIDLTSKKEIHLQLKEIIPVDISIQVKNN